MTSPIPLNRAVEAQWHNYVTACRAVGRKFRPLDFSNGYVPVAIGVVERCSPDGQRTLLFCLRNGMTTWEQNLLEHPDDPRMTPAILRAAEANLSWARDLIDRYGDRAEAMLP